MRYPLGVIAPEIGVRSETFVRWDVEELLPGGTVVVADPPPAGETVQSPPAWKTAAPLLRFDPVDGDPPPSPARRRAMREFLGDHGVEVVLVEYLDFAQRWYTPLRESGLRIWLRGHGVDLTARLREPAHRRGYRRLADADGIMVPSRAAVDRLRALGLPGERVHRVPNHTAVPATAPAPTPGGGLVRCVTIGRLVAKKGHHHSLAAIEQAARHVPGLRWEVVGDGPLRADLEARVHARGLAGRVRFRGALDHAHALDRLREADVLLHHAVTTSDGDGEGMPVAVLEALAAGVCVLATRHEGITDLVRDGITGRLVAEGDTAGMAEALAQLAQHPTERARLAHAGWAAAHAGFDHRRWRRTKLALLGLPDLAVSG